MFDIASTLGAKRSFSLFTCCVQSALFILLMGVAFLISPFVKAESVQGKIVRLESCIHSVSDSPEAFTLVTLDNNNVYRLGVTHRSDSHLAASRRNIYSMLLVAYERDYTVGFVTDYGAKIKCGISTLGHIQTLVFDKALN
ncbi:MAG: hypothetical protein R3E62_10050 [Pseudomonadales bacterium]